jgi:hypothetical protein
MLFETVKSIFSRVYHFVKKTKKKGCNLVMLKRNKIIDRIWMQFYKNRKQEFGFLLMLGINLLR